MKRHLILPVFLVFSLLAFQQINDDLFRVPKGWSAPVYDFSKNPLSEEKIALGRALFHDPILSRNNTISCTSCHSQYTGFAHTDHRLSHGIDDRIGTRNAPTLVNMAWQNAFMWDGAIHHLDMQSLAPIHHPDEMDETIENVVKKLQASEIYVKAFKKAFGDKTITGERVLKSLSQFMLTFVSSNAKYDQVKRGETTFTEQEEKGYALFQKNCESCHREPLFTNHQFANNGLPVDTALNDFGRMKMTKLSADSLKFKVPTLRNIEFSYPYMHDGRFKKLSEVLHHYTKGVQQSTTLASEIGQGIVLTSNEKVDLTAFLLTLTDKAFLFNKNFSYPKAFFAGDN
jgi:cytochrome c peroxidase